MSLPRRDDGDGRVDGVAVDPLAEAAVGLLGAAAVLVDAAVAGPLAGVEGAGVAGAGAGVPAGVPDGVGQRGAVARPGAVGGPRVLRGVAAAGGLGGGEVGDAGVVAAVEAGQVAA